MNYDLHNSSSINFNYKIKDILKNGYKNNKAIRKDAAIMVGTLVSSDKEFFDGLKEEDQRKYFEESYLYFKQRYGENNIISAVVHMDETTPHMHLYSVPLTSDGRLSGKEVISRATLREIQEELPERLQSKGFVIERGVEGSNVRHKDTLNFKKETVNNLKKEIEKYNKLTQSVTERYKALEGTIGLVNNIKPKKKLLGSNLTISEEDYITLCAKAEVGELNISKNAELRNEIEKLKSTIRGIENKLIDVENIKNKYASRNKILEIGIDEVKSTNKVLNFNTNVMLSYLDKINKKDDFVKFIDKYNIGNIVEFEDFKSKKIHGIITGHENEKIVVNEFVDGIKNITTMQLEEYKNLYIDLSKNYILDVSKIQNKMDSINQDVMESIQIKKDLFKDKGLSRNVNQGSNFKIEKRIEFEH